MYKYTKLNKLHCSLIVLLSSPVLLQAVELNDTGIGENKYSSEQSDYYFYAKDVADYPGQDPQYGRDALEQTDNIRKTGGGHAGFDFSDTSDCVLDNVTGLLWEVKTDASDSGLQSNKWRFAYLDSSALALEKVEVVKAVEQQQAPSVHQEIVLDSKVLFDYDMSDLKPEAKASIDEYLNGFRDQFDHIRAIVVTGHTDGVASQKYNQKLSEARARNVADYLESIEGIPDAEIEAIGKGKLEPIDTNETEEGRSNNRRVVINLEFDNMPVPVYESTLLDEGSVTNVKNASDTGSETLLDNNKHSTLPETAIAAICSDEENSINCDTETYIAKMNEDNLCGYDDWRLPSREELRSIVDYGFSMPAIDKDYFSNTLSSAYWTSNRYVNNDFRVWVVDFEHGGDNTHEKHRSLPIRLVRSDEQQLSQHSAIADKNSSNIDSLNSSTTKNKATEVEVTEEDSSSNFFSPITNLWK